MMPMEATLVILTSIGRPKKPAMASALKKRITQIVRAAITLNQKAVERSEGVASFFWMRADEKPPCINACPREMKITIIPIRP